jgi:hypothetical protein
MEIELVGSQEVVDSIPISSTSFPMKNPDFA